MNLEQIEKLNIYKERNKKISINIDGKIISKENFTFIPGPCSVESYDSLLEIAKSVKKIGCSFLRAGAYKARTSPYTFQGLGKEGLEILKEVKKETNLKIVCELTDINKLDEYGEIDIIQIGARNMQNFALLKELGKIKKPILLKRGFSNTITEFLLSSEYIFNSGNENIILCERGIRTFDDFTRNTFDVVSIPILKKLTPFPVIADPSHGTGIASLVRPAALSAAAIGSDGLLIEVHINPSNALSDKDQTITIEEFSKLYSQVNNILPFKYEGIV